MCGILGVVAASSEEVKYRLKRGLVHSRRRGHDSQGVTLANLTTGVMKTVTVSGDDPNGFVEGIDVGFGPCAGIGHTRMTTSEGIEDFNRHPMHLCEDGLEMSMCYNGNMDLIGQYPEDRVEGGYLLKRRIPVGADQIPTSDTGVFADIIFENLIRFGYNLDETIDHLIRNLRPAYAVGMIANNCGDISLRLFNDAFGVRPASYGKCHETGATAFASDDRTLFIMGDPKHQYLPIHFIDQLSAGTSADFKLGSIRVKQHVDLGELVARCHLEPMYTLSRLAYCFDGRTRTERVRYEIGYQAGLLFKGSRPLVDYVIAAPNSGLTYGYGVADALDLPFVSAVRKSDQKDTTAQENDPRFYQGTAKERKDAHKYLIDEEKSHQLSGKNVLIVDDSGIRLETSAKLNFQIKQDIMPANLYWLFADSHWTHRCPYGQNTNTDEELPAYHGILAGIVTKENLANWNYDALGLSNWLTDSALDILYSQGRIAKEVRDIGFDGLFFNSMSRIKMCLPLDHYCWAHTTGVRPDQGIVYPLV